MTTQIAWLPKPAVQGTEARPVAPGGRSRVVRPISLPPFAGSPS